MAKREDGILIATATTRETLTLSEGIIHARIAFGGGEYSSGRLRLHGDYPPSMAIGAAGRPFDAYVGHPAMRTSGVVADGASTADGALELRQRSG